MANRKEDASVVSERIKEEAMARRKEQALDLIPGRKLLKRIKEGSPFTNKGK